MVVANASNAAAVSDALAERIEGFRVVLDDRSLATALVAIQGPLSRQVMAPLTDLRSPICATTRSATGMWPASRRSWPAPATPARTASRSSWTSPRPAMSGTR